jgi:hypothetical protein
MHLVKYSSAKEGHLSVRSNSIVSPLNTVPPTTSRSASDQVQLQRTGFSGGGLEGCRNIHFAHKQLKRMRLAIVEGLFTNPFPALNIYIKPLGCRQTDRNEAGSVEMVETPSLARFKSGGGNRLPGELLHRLDLGQLLGQCRSPWCRVAAHLPEVHVVLDKRRNPEDTQEQNSKPRRMNSNRTVPNTRETTHHFSNHVITQLYINI